jgi:hypothetical protein
MYICLEGKKLGIKNEKVKCFLGGFLNCQNLKTKIARFLHLVAQNIYFCSQIWQSFLMDEFATLATSQN